ncbi:MAG: zinc ribbon domain-containing protein [Candidatus Atabeyarchaeum deiterrae]
MSKQGNKNWVFEDSEAVIGNNVVTFKRNEDAMSMVSLRHVASVDLNFNVVYVNIDQGDASSHEPAFFECKASTREEARYFFEALKQKMDFGIQMSNQTMGSGTQTSCPYCKSLIGPNAKFCSSCGSSLS